MIIVTGTLASCHQRARGTCRQGHLLRKAGLPDVRQAHDRTDHARHNRVFQTGLQQRNSPEYRKACELVHAGRIGEVKLAYVSSSGVSSYLNLPAEPLPDGLDWDMWLGPCPEYPYNYRYHQTGPPENVVPGVAIGHLVPAA